MCLTFPSSLVISNIWRIWIHLPQINILSATCKFKEISNIVIVSPTLFLPGFYGGRVGQKGHRSTTAMGVLSCLTGLPV